MIYVSDQDGENAGRFQIGGKAKNLFLLKKLGFAVPGFLVIPQETFGMLAAEKTSENPLHQTNSIRIPENWISRITDNFSGTKYYAVRSSATDEDGAQFSFAGQFESFLFVKKEQLAEKISLVYTSAFSQRVSEYRTQNHMKQEAGMAVIIQEMIDAQVSGVAFGVHPVTGNANQKMINAVYGVGEGIVSGALNADSFIVENNLITEKLVQKTHQFVHDIENGGTCEITVDDHEQHKPAVTSSQILELAAALDALQSQLRSAQDVEFAIKDNKLFLLQTRPVTTNAQPAGNYILWDNSNIVESYPGVTTPLTFSFISKSYEVAYKLFSGYLGVSEQVLKENDRVFANTLGFINGRVYYNLKTWYHMLAMLPGYSINARFMENMMGVKEQFDIPESYRLSKGKAWWSILKMTINMLFRFLALPEKRKEFQKLLNTTIARYKQINYAEKNANELVELYLTFEKTLLNEWKAPLLNDFFAMIWFGMLQKQCEQFSDQSPNLHNDLLCGSSDIISVEPIHRSIEIASYISDNEELKNLFTKNNEKNILTVISNEKNPSFVFLHNEIKRYIADFGERCVGELKLETVSYTQDPSGFIRILKSYVETGLTKDQLSGKTENLLRAAAEKQVDAGLGTNTFKRWKFNKVLSYARELVSARENLRYERTRAFGIVREIFSQLGNKFSQDAIIESPRDIFYLTKEEIISFTEGTSVTQDLRGLIAFRKNEFEKYKLLDPPAERFATYGPVYHANDFFNTGKVENLEGDLHGTGCSPGIVRAKVRVVRDPHETHAMEGDILVTTSTDPGWVTLFASASGIIVERGSLLSHSAIVSREMGKPCIVGVTGLLKTLKTGDMIEMNGSSGTIRILNG
jgi:phosphohistidine swiveling domain-containing protein